MPSGKQRQKKSGRGRPTAFFIASVSTAVTRTEYKRPAPRKERPISIMITYERRHLKKTVLSFRNTDLAPRDEDRIHLFYGSR